MTDEELVDRFVEEGSRVLAEMRSLAPEQLDLAGADGGSTPRFVAHHLADAEIVNARRLRRLLSEDNLHLETFDPMALSSAAHYERPIETSVALFEAIQAANVELVRSLDPSDWGRSGTHVELGPYSVSVWLTRRITHNAGHLEQIKAARRS